ncbi:hypothetical protein O0I10_000258 [Lichtheimia ornata]|uniref:Uncharacterized protein n=1 Tax=Lichtheimia ornata TaxID=688661 RepID=A0AAD7Y533_9FUNG|nr:uncharacterized protein O0I10_000258 [Lichtheimia ornata]KAJ8663982.1 hypothetical protein O0I10_000258 [Lichtheimia ornata]
MSTAILPEQQQQAAQQQQQQQSSGYKSFLKPTKFWKGSANNKVASSPEEQQQQPAAAGKPFALTMPTFKKPGLLQPKEQPANALRETPKAEIYKLSTINDSGVYLPPSPTQEGKRDHWLDLDEQVLAFRLPAPECLTTYGTPQQHKGESLFHTPSVIINQQQHHHHQSSVSTSTTEDDIPSLMTDSSSTSPL